MDREEFETQVGDLVADALATSVEPQDVIEVLTDQIRAVKEQSAAGDDVPDESVD